MSKAGHWPSRVCVCLDITVRPCVHCCSPGGLDLATTSAEVERKRKGVLDRKSENFPSPDFHLWRQLRRRALKHTYDAQIIVGLLRSISFVMTLVAACYTTVVAGQQRRACMVVAS